MVVGEAANNANHWDCLAGHDSHICRRCLIRDVRQRNLLDLHAVGVDEVGGGRGCFIRMHEPHLKASKPARMLDVRLLLAAKILTNSSLDACPMLTCSLAREDFIEFVRLGGAFSNQISVCLEAWKRCARALVWRSFWFLKLSIIRCRAEEQDAQSHGLCVYSCLGYDVETKSSDSMTNCPDFVLRTAPR